MRHVPQRRQHQARSGPRRRPWHEEPTPRRGGGRAREHALRDVVLPPRRIPDRVVAHLGPANSGKTHAGLEALIAAGSGAYAAPLRMLANEAYERLSARLGTGRVGLVTGEERINERAPVIACTVEMLSPRRRGVVVLDEVHWAADPERGSAWTNVLWHSGADELYLAGAPDAEPLLRAAYGDAFEIVWTHRLTGPLRFVGGVHLDALQPASVVVAFSRSAVMALASRIHERRGGQVGVLYGAMPVAARRHQISEFITGRTEVLVSTDVLGHGVNLPCRAVVFAETAKFDGVERRDLMPWEVAQIAGRAGRFGLLEDGAVGWLGGLEWLAPEPRVIEQGLQPPTAVGPDRDVPAYRRLTRAQFGPARGDFATVPPHRWPAALELWARAARSAVKEAGWLRTASVEPIRDRLLVLGPQRLRRLSADDAWSLAIAPLDAGDHGELLARFADALITRHSLADLIDLRDLASATLEEAEQRSAQAAVLRWFTRRHPGAGKITSADADALEAAASARVIALVPGAITKTSAGRCIECGREAAPWFTRCDRCHARAAVHEDDDAPWARGRPRATVDGRAPGEWGRPGDRRGTGQARGASDRGGAGEGRGAADRPGPGGRRGAHGAGGPRVGGPVPRGRGASRNRRP